MGKNLELRLVIGSDNGPRSATWSIFTSGNEAYAAHRSMLGIEKFSFHSSRICRRAFLENRPLPNGMSDRVLKRWTRAATLPEGNLNAVVVLSIIFPTSHLSGCMAFPKKTVRWVEPARSDSSKVLQLLFTQEGEATLSQLFAEEENELIAYHQLPNGEAFAVRAGTTDWEGRTLIVPASEGEHEDLVLPHFATPTQDRPINMTLYFQPNEMRCFELTGFKMPVGKAALVFRDADYLNSRTIIDKGNRLSAVGPA